MTPSSRSPGQTPGAGLQAARAQLDGATPAGLNRLSDAELLDLAQAIHEARRRHAQALAEAGDRALALIPRLLRGPVRKIVGA